MFFTSGLYREILSKEYNFRRSNHMKNIVRAFVVVLALTGAVASTQLSSASTQRTVVVAKSSAMPIPTCPPDDPNACGMFSK